MILTALILCDLFPTTRKNIKEGNTIKVTAPTSQRICKKVPQLGHRKGVPIIILPQDLHSERLDIE
jgi:hypothetical protein